jgi:deoxyribose-phosphate aldolase
LNLNDYLDSTYLKTAEQAGLSEEENRLLAQQCVDEAIAGQYRLAMIRPEYVADAAARVAHARSRTLVGTVIGFPSGTATIAEKLAEAEAALADGADELDFVCHYEAFRKGDTALLRKEVLEGTSLVLAHGRTIKWIIETAALDASQIIRLTALIRNTVLRHFKEDKYPFVYIKSSTGFYATPEDVPNGATLPAVIMMLENAWPLPVKASGGIRSRDEALAYIRMGVKRIGTSAARAILEGSVTGAGY